MKKALHKLMKLRRDGRAEKIRLETELEQMSAEIPIVVEVLQGAGAAAEISRELRSNSGTGLARRSSSDGGLTVSLETPAGRTRQAFERGGWGALTLEEQQWVTMDQVSSRVSGLYRVPLDNVLKLASHEPCFRHYQSVTSSFLVRCRHLSLHDVLEKPMVRSGEFIGIVKVAYFHEGSFDSSLF